MRVYVHVCMGMCVREGKCEYLACMHEGRDVSSVCVLTEEPASLIRTPACKWSILV